MSFSSLSGVKSMPPYSTRPKVKMPLLSLAMQPPNGSAIPSVWNSQFGPLTFDLPLNMTPPHEP
jgi:hypothetical protein